MLLHFCQYRVQSYALGRKVYAAAQIMLWIEHAEDKKQSALISVGNISKTRR